MAKKNKQISLYSDSIQSTSDHFMSTDGIMSDDDNRPVLSDHVIRLGYGYRGRGTWMRRPTLTASAAQASYKYRRPIPCQDDDDMAQEAQEANKDLVGHELEAGLRQGEHAPPEDGDGGDHAGDENGRGDGDGDGGDEHGRGDGEGGDGDGAGDDDDELYTARSSPIHSCSLDSEAVLAFAMDWESPEGAGAGGQKDKKLSPSPDPALFQEEREAARSMLAAGAFYASLAKAMGEEHKRARKEADLYMEEVTIAMKMLPTANSAVLKYTFSFPGHRVD